MTHVISDSAPRKRTLHLSIDHVEPNLTLMRALNLFYITVYSKGKIHVIIEDFIPISLGDYMEDVIFDAAAHYMKATGLPVITYEVAAFIVKAVAAVPCNNEDNEVSVERAFGSEDIVSSEDISGVWVEAEGYVSELMVSTIERKSEGFQDWALFYTNSGYVGTCPHCARKGDEL